VTLEVLLDRVPAQEEDGSSSSTLQANTDLDKIYLKALLSEGLKIVAGDPHWQGNLPAGGEQVLELSMTVVRLLPQTVTIWVQGGLLGGTSLWKKDHPDHWLKGSIRFYSGSQSQVSFARKRVVFSFP
jgi:hypothetical protein